MLQTSTVQDPFRKQAYRSSYFFWMSVILLLLVIAGFGSAALVMSTEDLEELPFRLHIHAVLLLCWFIWFVLQTSLIRSARISVHRRMGKVGALIGALCIFAGPLATIGAVRKFHLLGLDWGTDMSAYPKLGIDGMTVEQFSRFLVFGNFASVVVFGVLLVFAVYYRTHAETHKRLILLASLSFAGPPLARISRWPGLGGEDGIFIPVMFLVLLLSLVVHDLFVNRRVHKATWVGLLFLILTNAAFIGVSGTALGTWVIHALV
jgi:hypothetical protein